MKREDLENIDKPFGELDEVTQWALQGAFSAGCGIQRNDSNVLSWVLDPTPIFMDQEFYRLAPKPKTKPYFPPDMLPVWVKFISVDEDASAFAYRYSPMMFEMQGLWDANGRNCGIHDFPMFERGTCEWKDSLTSIEELREEQARREAE